MSRAKDKRASKPHTKAKYKVQFGRTYNNKLRRIRRSNGPEAAAAYAREFRMPVAA